MRTIERTSAFKRDYKRVKATPRYKNIETLLAEILRSLALDRSLAERHSDHALAGEWKDHRECHLKPLTLAMNLVLNSRAIGETRARHC